MRKCLAAGLLKVPSCPCYSCAWCSDTVHCNGALQISAMGGADLCDRLLEACAKLGEAELAVLTVQSMHALGLPVGYVAHGSVLRALCLAGYHEVSAMR